MFTSAIQESLSLETSLLTDGRSQLQKFGAALLSQQSSSLRVTRGRRAMLAAGMVLAIPLITASHCEGQPHPDAPGAGTEVQPTEQSSLPAGGTPCTGIDTIRNEFTCGDSGITGAYSESFGKGHYHVDHHDERVAAGDRSFPVYEEVAIDGMCVIIHHANEEQQPDIQLYQQSCSAL